MDATLAWTVVGSAAGVVGAAGMIVFGVIPLVQARLKERLSPAETRTRVGQSESISSLLKTGAVIADSIDKYDPIRDLGISPAIDIAGGPRLPVYVTRSIDPTLDNDLKAGGLIIVEGDSASGKSRTTHEAICRNWTTLQLRSVIVPRDGISLRKLVEAGYKFHRTVIWLDDLERFLQPEGLDEGIVRVLTQSANRVIMLATIRSRAKAAFGINAARPDLHSFGFDARRVFAAAKTHYLDRELNEAERNAAYAFRSDARIAAALESSAEAGFAGYIAAGPALVEVWQAGKRGANLVGAALVSAAIDFQRAGYLGPIPRLWLEAAFQAYLDHRTRHQLSPVDLEDGFTWATKAVRGASSCLLPLDGNRYAAFDYLVDFVQKEADSLRGDSDQPDASFKALHSIPEEAWHTLGENVSIENPYYLSCVSASSVSLHPGMSFSLKKAMEDGNVRVASLNSGDQLFALARTCMELHLCVACQVSVLGLDLGVLIEYLLDVVRPLIEAASPRLTDPQQVEALHVLSFVIDDEEPLQPGMLLYNTLREFDVDRLHQLGSLFSRLSDDVTGTAWLRAADAMRESR